ncbi:MAG: hypothetical protein WC809_08435 [Sinimarinibacterium sp.]|jgi:hypothetical protein
MNRNILASRVVVAGCLLAGFAVQPALACEDGPAKRASVNPILVQALDQLRQEQQVQMQQAARTGLAQLRSETATALAQGAATKSSAAVKAAP